MKHVPLGLILYVEGNSEANVFTDPITGLVRRVREVVIRRNGSCLTLEVISGPSCGIRCSVQSMNSSRLPVTLGRVLLSDLLIKDLEVSGKHTSTKWNLDLVDMGSLNGTLLNSKPISHPDSGSRLWGDTINLADGDIITLGTTSKIIRNGSSRLKHPSWHSTEDVYLGQRDTLDWAFDIEPLITFEKFKQKLI